MPRKKKKRPPQQVADYKPVKIRKKKKVRKNKVVKNKPKPRPKPRGAVTRPRPKPKPRPYVPKKTWGSEQQSAFDLMSSRFKAFGLPMATDVITVLRKAALDGDDAETVDMNLQQTQSWKTRFKGNEMRRAANKSVLSVAEYLQQERDYAATMHAYGMPTGFYDSPADYANFIGNDLSVSELKERLDIGMNVARREDPSVTAELARQGLRPSDVAAWVIDPARGLPLIQNKLQSVLIGGAARRAGLVANQDYLKNLADWGLTEQQAGEGYGQVAQMTRGLGALGDIYGVDYEQTDAEKEIFESNAAALDKRRKIANAEQAAFGGSSSFGVTKKNTSGQF